MNRPGVALLEVIVSAALIAASAAAVTATATASLQAVEAARSAQEELLEASAFLEAVALWPRDDLELRLGLRRQGPWLLEIQHRDGPLYDVALMDSSGTRTLLATRLYRPLQ